MYSLIRIRYFISVAAWLIPAITHFLCGSQLQVLKCVSISISCLFLSDINTCSWLSLEMFYFGFNACSFQVIYYSGTKGLGKGGGWYVIPGLLGTWRVVGYSQAAYGPQKIQANLEPAWFPPGCQGLFPDAAGDCSWAAKGHSERWGSPRVPPHPGCWILALENFFLFTFDFSPRITSHNPTFSNTKVFRVSWGTALVGYIHHPPSSSSFSFSGHPAAGEHPPHNSNYTGTFPHRALEAHNFQYHQPEIPHPTLNPVNPREPFQDCFTAQGWNGLRLSSKRIIFFPFSSWTSCIWHVNKHRDSSAPRISLFRLIWNSFLFYVFYCTKSTVTGYIIGSQSNSHARAFSC